MNNDKINEEVYDAAVEEEQREEERRLQRRARAERMKQAKKRSMMLRKYAPIAGGVAAAVILIIVVAVNAGKKNPRVIEPQTQSEAAKVTENETVQEEPWSFDTYTTDQTADFPESVVSKYGILIDAQTGEVIAEREGQSRIVPASMTKVMTVLVAAEQVTEDQMNDRMTLTKEIADFSYTNKCSNAGYELDEPMTVRDLFYGTILPSGADAAMTLANYVSGSQEAFVALMNQKAQELGIAGTTHFTNCVGLYDEDHYTTPHDMAVILKAASDNEFCREVLSKRTYTTEKTEQHPDGLVISNKFLRRIKRKQTRGTVLCAKTGYVTESGSCAASLGVDKDGKEYLLVTAGSTTSWRCVYDQVDIYACFLPEEEAQ